MRKCVSRDLFSAGQRAKIYHVHCMKRDKIQGRLSTSTRGFNGNLEASNDYITIF